MYFWIACRLAWYKSKVYLNWLLVDKLTYLATTLVRREGSVSHSGSIIPSGNLPVLLLYRCFSKALIDESSSATIDLRWNMLFDVSNCFIEMESCVWFHHFTRAVIVSGTDVFGWLFTLSLCYWTLLENFTRDNPRYYLFW